MADSDEGNGIGPVASSNATSGRRVHEEQAT